MFAFFRIKKYCKKKILWPSILVLKAKIVTCIQMLTNIIVILLSDIKVIILLLRLVAIKDIISMWIVKDIISRSCAKVKHRITFNIIKRCFGRHNWLIKIKKQLRKTFAFS